MTTASTTLVTAPGRTRIATMALAAAARAADRWRLYRTRRILAGLDARTLKDIGAPVQDGPGVSADPRFLRQLDLLR